MPLFEYCCESCGTRFEALVQGSSRPACTKCGGKKLAKLHSTFAVSAGGGAPSAPLQQAGCGSCGDPRGPGSCKTDG
jgi:putative FmdB family regulatory protein